MIARQMLLVNAIDDKTAFRSDYTELSFIRDQIFMDNISP